MKNDNGSILLTIANAITTARLLTVPLVIFLLANSKEHMELEKIAIFVLVLLQASDILDGFLARQAQKKLKTTNLYGQIMDPAADKIYINSTYLTLSITQNFPWWITLIVLSKDVLIFIGWFVIILLNGNKSVKPDVWGKSADTCQAFLIFAFLLRMPYHIFEIGGLVTVILTIISGLTLTIREIQKKR